MEFNSITTQMFDQSSIMPNKSKINNEGQKNSSFQSVFNEVLKNTNTMVLESEELTEEIAVGKSDNIHQVLIATQKADIALQLTLQIRNKVLDAYNEIMRMQI